CLRADDRHEQRVEPRAKGALQGTTVHSAGCHVGGELLGETERILGATMKGLGLRAKGSGTITAITLASLILLASCGGPAPQQQAAAPAPAAQPAPPPPAPYYVYVTNETGGDLSVIHGGTNEVVDTIVLGKRPRAVR